MNLHSVVSGAIGAINPPVLCMLSISEGYNVQKDGTQTPNYRIVPNVPVQIQSLSYTDLMKLGGLNIEGVRKKAYLNGSIEGIDRQAIKGGDLFTIPDTPGIPGPTTWLVAQSLEDWPDWCALALTLQLKQ